MHEPDDFGLSSTQTMLQVADATPPRGYVHFWSEWSQRVWADEPRLEPYEYSEHGPSPGALGLTHTFVSAQDVRIGCRLVAPPGEVNEPPQAVVITSHGYSLAPGEALDDTNPWTPHGLAVLKVRVRGYPGSQLDTGDLTRHDLGFITIGLEDRTTWIVGQCVADVVNAARAARARYGPRVPIMLHGESFGGGLAVLAASQLAGRMPPARMVIALPSLGWWSWRLAQRPHAGIGLDVRRFIDGHRGGDDQIAETLRMFDAVVHAKRVACPVLCKIAERDDVVPAPTAAAIYNALSSDPGLKWRFVTRYGHYDGGLADLRRHVLFERLAGSFLTPSVELGGLMRRWESVLVHGEKPPPDERS